MQFSLWIGLPSFLVLALQVSYSEARNEVGNGGFLPDINCNPCIDREATRLKAIVHGTTNDLFWQQVQKSMQQAAIDMRVQLDLELYNEVHYSEAQMYDDIMAAGEDETVGALIVTIPSPLVENAVRQVAGKVPVFGLNSGYQRAQKMGVLNFVAMDDYKGGVVAAKEFLSQARRATGSHSLSKALFINHAPENSAVQSRFVGFQDTLPKVTTSSLSLEVDMDQTTMKRAIDAELEECPYDIILLAGSLTFEATRSALKSQNCTTTQVATFDQTSEIFDAIAVGDLAFSVSQQQHLQGSLSVVLAAIYASTSKTLAYSSDSEFGSYISGPKVISRENLPGDTLQNCEVASFPVCSKYPASNASAAALDGQDSVEFLTNRACPCTDRSKIKIGGVVHGDTTSSFWDVVFEQAYQAADDLGVELLLDRMEPQENTEVWHAKMASKIISLCQEDVDGLFVSIPSDRVVAAIKQCQELNVPVISINSGAKIATEELGLTHHISQLEYEAGFAAGQRFADTGRVKEAWCYAAERNNVGIEERCQGFEAAINEAASKRTDIVFKGKIYPEQDLHAITMQRIKDQVNQTGSWEGVGILSTGQTLAREIVVLKKEFPDFVAGAFDLSETIYKGLDDGVFQFAIDQNAFAQGYMPVWLLTLMTSSKQHLGNTFIESGPTFVEGSPSAALQYCVDNNFKVCERPMEAVLNDNLVGPGILAFGYVAVSISWGLSIYFLGWMVKNRHLYVVKASQPGFLVMICIGAMVSSSTLVALSFQAGTNGDLTMASNACTAAPFLYSIGWVLMFSSLCAKTYRMFKVMKNCREHKHEIVTFGSMVTIVVAALSIDIIIVVSWALVNPLVYKREKLNQDFDPETGIVTIESVGYCTNEDEDGPDFWVFAGPLLAIHLILMILTNVLLYKVSGMKDRYQESKYISFAMLLMLETVVVGVPIAVAVGDPQAIFVILIGTIAVHDIAVLSLLFIPKILFQSSTSEEMMNSKEDSVILASLSRVSKTRFGQAMDILDDLADPENRNGLTDTERAELREVKTLLIQRNNNNNRLLHVPAQLFAKRSANPFILREFAGVVDQSETDTISMVSRISLSGNRESSIATRTDGVYTLPEFDELLNDEKKKHVFRLLSWSNLKRWDFSIFDLVDLTGGHPLLFVGWAVLGSPYSQFAMAKACGCADDVSIDDFQGYNFKHSSLKIPIKKLCDYLRAVEADYNEANPYHNAIHAADVLQTLHTLIQMKPEDFTVKTELFSILLAAAVHDVKHPGKNNSFQINANTPVALVYNDKSVLENKHASHAFMLMLRQPTDDLLDDDDDMDLNLLSNVDRKNFADIRKKVVEAVLHTDMSEHFANQDAMKGLLEDQDRDNMDAAARWNVLMYMLHLADISNPAKGDPLFKLWTDRCLEEFFAQGDVEAEMGLPVSPNCDRKTTRKPDSQVGFIKFVIKPAYEVLVLAIPKVGEGILPVIDKNLEYWLEEKDRCKEEAVPR